MAKKPKINRGPLWKGPEGEGPLGGITFSMLSKFLTCRERFRVSVIEGWRPEEKFNHYIEYGQMWHLCEEMVGQGMAWEGPLEIYAQNLCVKYPLNRDDIAHWYHVCAIQFAAYERYYEPSNAEQHSYLLTEHPFDIPHTLPSGRTVRLRGKWDAVLLSGGKILLMENKTKSEVDEEAILKQLKWDLQTMLYLIAMENPDGLASYIENNRHPLGGVLYNVIRRPLSGGKGSIRRKKATKTKGAESARDFYARVAQVIEEDLDSFFVRFRVDVTPDDVKRFQTQCLDPILENVCDWYDEVTGHCKDNPFEYRCSSDSRVLATHWRHPYGVRNGLDDGYDSEYDNYLETGSTVGLRRVDTLFTELTVSP